MRFWTIVFLIATLCFALGGCLFCFGAPVTLAWNASTDPVVTGYNVYYGGACRAYTNEVNAGAATSVTISNLTPDVTYYIAATTYTAPGMESPFSSEVVYLVRTNAVAKATRIVTVTCQLVQITTATNITGPWLVSTNFKLQPSAFSIATLTNPPEPARFWRGVVVLDISQTNR